MPPESLFLSPLILFFLMILPPLLAPCLAKRAWNFLEGFSGEAGEWGSFLLRL